MSKPQYLVLDTLDDRREIHHLLARLRPRQRIQFMEWACQQATLPNSRTHPGVNQRTRHLALLAERDDSADRRLTLDLFFDCWHLAMNYDFDLDLALARLVALVRGL